MADAYVQLPADGAGKRFDSESLTVDGVLVYRGRNQVVGTGETDIAAVLGSDPGVSAVGLVTRTVGVEQPVVDALSSSSLAAGASIDLDGTTIANLATGKLMAVSVGSSAACKWVIKTRNGGVEVEKGTIYTGGLCGGPSGCFQPPDKNFITLAGSGVDENFRVTVTNLDYENAADVKATIFWDEIS